MRIRVIQTCDPVRYRAMFDVTSVATRRWCATQDLEDEPFIGLKCGRHPWHAIFNRIVLLYEIAATDYAGWVIYLDADAYPFDLSFDVRAYLASCASFALVAAIAGGPERWQPNDGILLFNFAVPAAREIIRDWHTMFETLTPVAYLDRFPEWPVGTEDDQTMLHRVLLARSDLAVVMKLEPHTLMGRTTSTFLRQILRTDRDGLDARSAEANTGVKVALMMADVWVGQSPLP